MYRWLLALALALALPGASGAQMPEPGASAAPLMTLPAELRERFVQRVMVGRPSQRERLERIVDFVFDAQHGLGMVYEDGATHTVEQSYATRSANCLGFTLLFLALGREAGLEIHPQVYDETLAWHRKQGIFYRNSHVNAVVRIGARSFTLDVARNAVITRGRPERLTERGLLANYRNNRAVELLELGDLAAARQHMTAALELEPAKASHWSNAGVLELRSGDAAAARRAYERALELDPGNSNALFNMVSMARREGDREREAEFRERLQRVQQEDPFHHFLQAIDYELAGDFARSVPHYRRAIELHRRDHRFHAALANALQRSGDTRGAREALRRAIFLSDGTVRAAYQAQLFDLGTTAD